MNLVPISSFSQLIDMLPGLHPNEHHVLVNTIHPLIGGVPDRLPELVLGVKGTVLDFDGTLHPGNQWALARERLMSRVDADEDAWDAKRYFERPHHDDAADVAFIMGSVWRLMVSNGCRRADLEGLGLDLAPRAGAIELIRSIGYERAAVVTFGMFDVVNKWLCHFLRHACWSDVETFALRFEWRIDGDFRRPILQTLVTDGNKGYWRRAFGGARALAPRETLVVGDSPTDIQMMGSDVVGCFLIPKIDPQPGRMAHRLARMNEMWPQVACVLVSDSLEPLVEMRQ